MPANKGQKRDKRDTLTIWRWPLPKDVRGCYAHFAEDVGLLLENGPDNPALFLQRYVAYPASEKVEGVVGKEIMQRLFNRTFGRWELKGARKNELWRAVIKRLAILYGGESGRNLIDAIRSRWELIKGALEAQGYKVRTIEARVAWRLVVGLGLPSPFETGINLHHLYGFPYLPGTAIKGVTRLWKLLEISSELGVPRLGKEEAEKKGSTPWQCLEQLLMSPEPRGSEEEKVIKERLKLLQQVVKKTRASLAKGEPKVLSFDPERDFEKFYHQYIRDFSRAFGTIGAKGEVIFFDAYPLGLTVNGLPILELDVMTPHYSEYYTKDKPPADWLNPVPVFFLVVREGTKFLVPLACRDEVLLRNVEKWVKEALKELGIGAKTHSGYGELRASES